MKKYIQFLKFVLVGVSNTLLSEVIYVVLIFLGWHYLLANLIGQLLSVLNAFFWSNKIVFKEDSTKEKRVWWQVLLKTYAAYSWSFVVNLALLYLWVDLIGIARWMNPFVEIAGRFGWGVDADTMGKLVAEFVNLLLTVPMNYFVNKYWAYRQKPKAKSGNS